MTNKQTLTSLSIAAIALMAAAVPCFAQTSAIETRPEAGAAVSEVAVAINRTPGSVMNVAPASSELPSTKAVTPNRGITFSVETFKATSHTTTSTSNFLKSQPTTEETVLTFSMKQLKVDNDVGSERRTSRIEFVPSRGQKLPE